MTIMPQYTITEQTLTHVTLQIQVPHVRFNVEEIQISFSNEETTVHFYCPPIYLLVLNFAPYRFRNVEDDECQEGDDGDESDEHRNQEIPSDCVPTTTTRTVPGTPQRHHRAKYLPHVQNGMIQLILEKHLDHQEHWPDLDLLGKLQQQQQRTNCMSHDIWTAAATSSTTTTTTTTTTSAAAAKLNWLREIVSDDINENDQTESLPSHDQLQSSTSMSPPTPTQSLQNYYTGTYGFHRMFAHIYDDLQRENSIMTQMLECPWPMSTTTATTMPVVPPTNDADDHHRVAAIRRQRQEQRHEQYENSKFNVERYIQDLDIDECDDYIYDHAMSLIPHWNQPPQHSEEETSNDYFTSTERQLLTSIPYPLLDDVILAPPLTTTTVETESMSHPPPLSSQLALGMGLIDILYAYVYDQLTTIDQEATVESSWTISTLSISLSWLHDWLPNVDKMTTTTTTTTNHSDVTLEGHHSTHIDDMVRSVMQSSIRRSLIYPYIRNFSFSIYVWENVISILDNPNHDSNTRIRTIIRCLLQVRNILNYSDIYYLGNKLYIDPYLIWIQKFSDLIYFQNQVLSPIAQSIRQQLLSETLKDSLDMNLLQIEAEFYNDIIDDGDNNDGGSQGAGESDSGTSSSDDEDDKSNGGLPDASQVSEIQIRTFADDDHVSNESYDVDAAASALQRLELLPGEPNASNDLSASGTTAKATSLDDLLSICTNFESLKTDVNQESAPLIQEVD